MKQIFLIIGLLLIALSVSAQDPSIDRGSGVMYFSGVPGYEPDTTVQSEIAYNLLSRELWVFNRDSVKWKKNSAYSQSYADPSGDPTPGPFLHVNRADGGIFQWTGAAWEEFTPGTSAVADGVTILGDGSGGDPFTVDTTLIATIQGVADSGYVVGPASATDNAIARYDATTGKLIQNSAVTIGDAGAMTLNGGNIILNGEYLSGDGGDEGVYVDANGYVGIGTNSPSSYLHLSTNSTGSDAWLFLQRASSASANHGPGLVFKRSRGSIGSPTAVQSGDILSYYVIDAHDGTGFEGERRVMQVDATENWTGSQAGFGWGFYIRNNGSSGAPTEILRLEESGNVGIQETDPAHELDVTGDISATGSLISDGGDVQLNSVGDVFVKTNAGTPESAVTGDPGALVLDVSNGAAYVKETGISSTGWGQLATIQGVADSGYVVGPASATDNAIARYDATTGKLIQNSAITIGDAGAMTLNGGNILLNGEWLSGDGGDEGVFVASDGRVGVGNSAPVSALDINSTGVTTAGPAGIDITNMITSTVSSSGIQGVMFRNNSTSSTAEVRFITIANNIGEYMAFTTPSTTNSGTFFGDTKGGGNFIFSSGRPLYLGTIQTDDILFGTNNSTIHMIIDHSSSNVGIGDETPSTKLDVNGDITAQGGTINLNSALDVFVQTNAGTPEAAVTADPGSLILDTSNGATYVKETGTSSTGWAQLATIQGVADSGYVVGPASATDNAIARYDATTGKLIQNSAITIDDTGGLTMNGDNIALNGEWLSGDGDDEGMTIDATGQAGFGIASPDYVFHIATNSTASNAFATIQRAGDAANRTPGLLFRRSRGSVASPTGLNNADIISYYLINGHNGVDWEGERRVMQIDATEGWSATNGGFGWGFYSRPNGSVGGPTEIMRLEHNGNVGIQETDPVHELDVTGDISATGSLISDGGDVQLNSVGDVFVKTNAGTPESAVTGDPGALVLDVSNGAAYVKETGTSSTGWAQLLTSNISSASAPVLFAEHSVTSTGTITAVVELQKTTTATMVNGFGPGLYFTIRDVDAVDNAVGLIGVARAGADNSGEMRFYTSNAGVSTLGQTIEADQDILFDEYTTNAKNGVGTMNAYVTMDANGQLYRMENSRAAMRVSGGSTSFVSATPERVDGDTPGTTTDLGSTSDWTVSGSGMSYTGTVTRDFKILCELDGTTDSVAELDFYIAEEGTVISGTIMETTIGNANDNHSVSLLWIVSAATNDTYEVYVDGDANENYTNNNLVCIIEPWDN